MAISLKRAKKAPSAYKPPDTVSGGTTAPPNAAKSGLGSVGTIGSGHGFQEGIGSSSPASAGAGGGAGGAGAQGGTPAASGANPPPETQQRLRERAEEGLGYGEAGTQYHQDLYNAAMRYGDPAVTALYAPGVGAPPTGQVEQIAKQEKEQQAANELAHNANNTFFSGHNAHDINAITENANTSRAKALQEFEQAKKEYDDAYNEAIATHQFAGEGFDEAAQREFNETEPTPQGGGGGGKGDASSGGSGKGGNGNGGKGNQNKTLKKNPNVGPAKAVTHEAVGQSEALKKKKK